MTSEDDDDEDDDDPPVQRGTPGYPAFRVSTRGKSLA